MLLLLLACAERVGTVRTDGRGPAVVDPPVPALEAGDGHALGAGWSEDGRKLFYCALQGTRVCRYLHLDGLATTSAELGTPGVEPPPAPPVQVAAPGTWAYTDALALTWELEPGVRGGRDAVLRVGARVRSGGRATFPLTLSQPGYDTLHIEFLGLSPDGSHLGVVAHAVGVGPDAFVLGLVPTQKLVYGAFSAGK